MAIEVKGIDKVTKKTQAVMKAAKNLRPAFDKAGPIVIQEFKANFPAKGGVLQKPWPARKRYYPWPLMQKTGKLKGAWEKRAGGQEMKIRNTAKYAAYHHFGTARLPIRALVAKTQKITKIVMDRILAYIKPLIK